jgi:hypothetical protein
MDVSTILSNSNIVSSLFSRSVRNSVGTITVITDFWVEVTRRTADGNIKLGTTFGDWIAMFVARSDGKVSWNIGVRVVETGTIGS